MDRGARFTSDIIPRPRIVRYKWIEPGFSNPCQDDVVVCSTKAAMEAMCVIHIPIHLGIY